MKNEPTRALFELPRYAVRPGSQLLLIYLCAHVLIFGYLL